MSFWSKYEATECHVSSKYYIENFKIIILILLWLNIFITTFLSDKYFWDNSSKHSSIIYFFSAHNLPIWAGYWKCKTDKSNLIPDVLEFVFIITVDLVTYLTYCISQDLLPKARETGWFKYKQNSLIVKLENKIWGDIACCSVQVYAYVKWHCGGIRH